MFTALPCETSYSTRQDCDNGSDEDVKERCGGKTLQTLKEKIIVERKRKGLEEMPDILEPPKTYKVIYSCFLLDPMHYRCAAFGKRKFLS